MDSQSCIREYVGPAIIVVESGIQDVICTSGYIDPYIEDDFGW